MKQYVTLLTFMLFGLVASAQSPCKDGLCVVQFNAEWNAGKSVNWLGDLTDCKSGQLLICENPKYQAKYKIVVVPTIIVFKDGEVHSRHQADIMMKMIHNQEDLQKAIDDAHMDGF